MNIIAADDSEMARKQLESKLTNACQSLSVPLNILGIVHDGQQLVNLFEQVRATNQLDFIFCDIRMPNMDGLSALVKIRSLDRRIKFVMVSSEDSEKMEFYNKFRQATDNAAMEFQKKIDLLSKISGRIVSNAVEPGKINSMLEGCEKLAADPIEVAKAFGANGYLHKPYDDKRTLALLNMLLTEPGFAVVA